MISSSDIRGNAADIYALEAAPPVVDATRDTIVVALAQDEVLKLIEDLAKSAWAGGTHLVVEVERPTFRNAQVHPATDKCAGYCRGTGGTCSIGESR